MEKLGTLVCTIILFSILVLGTGFVTHPVSAANITCDPGVRCEGTAGNDKILGTKQGDRIDAKNGKDNVKGSDGDDIICGGPGDDTVRGGKGKDTIYGGQGDIIIDCGTSSFDADKIYGGPGNDFIYHNGHSQAEPENSWNSDRHTDYIDCGPGDDVAIINLSVDHDVTVNCEHVSAGDCTGVGADRHCIEFSDGKGK